MTGAIRALVRRRAGERCEYCRLRQEDSPRAVLHIEHIRPRKHGGSDRDDNLCLACIDCNLHKGSNLTGIDPHSDAVTDLSIRVSKGGTITLLGRASISSGGPPWAARLCVC